MNNSMRKRRKKVQQMATIHVDDPSGLLEAMTPFQRSAYVIQQLRRIINGRQRK